jgi:UDP-N-acetylmuramoylalanine--D-glutamate ligase
MGLGVSGAAAAHWCLSQGALVRGTDQAEQPAGAQALAHSGVELYLGGHRPEDFAWADLLVLSPGVDQRQPLVAGAVARGAEVIGEMELGWRFLTRPAVMITGTNGKSTVTTLIGRMLEAAGRRVFMGGNLGSPLCRALLDGQDFDWAVLEVSSFQTDTGPSLSPRVGLVTNLTPDHLDRYDSFEQYAASKLSLLAHQSGDQVGILCADDPELMARRNLAGGRLWLYGGRRPDGPGGWLEGGDLVLAPEPGQEVRLSGANSKLAGGFNRLNLLGASLAALAAGVEADAVQRVIDEFPGLSHRLQWVAEKNGVIFFDDSKGTNVGAVEAALAALERRAVLLLGGRDKEGDFRRLIPLIRQREAGVICFGEAGPLIQGQLAPDVQAELAPDLAGAVQAAARLAKPGQAVLLSPGCASFDAYTSYAARGDHFQSLVREADHD